jgi:hypothetical protein
MALKRGFQFTAAVLLAASVFLVTAVAPADARKRRKVIRAMPAVSGLAASHSMRIEGGRMCFADHFHYGSGTGSVRRAAEIDAVKAWAGFVDFEYGGSWASYGRSSSKQMTCAQGGTGWSCDVSARPCR